MCVLWLLRFDLIITLYVALFGLSAYLLTYSVYRFLQLHTLVQGSHRRSPIIIIIINYSPPLPPPGQKCEKNTLV